MAVINKAGCSMFWDSCFEDKINFKRSLKISLLCKQVVKLFFKGRSSRTIVFYKRRIFKKILEKYRPAYKSNKRLRYRRRFYIYFDKIKNLKKLVQFYKEYKPIPCYFGKIFFIKYNNWIIVTFRIFMPISKVFLRRYFIRTLRKKVRSIIYWKYYFLASFKQKYSIVSHTDVNKFIYNF